MDSEEKKLEELYLAFDEECEKIACQCEEEGYPAYGSTYELRVENLMKSYPYSVLFEEEG